MIDQVVKSERQPFAASWHNLEQEVAYRYVI